MSTEGLRLAGGEAAMPPALICRPFPTAVAVNVISDHGNLRVEGKR